MWDRNFLSSPSNLPGSRDNIKISWETSRQRRSTCSIHQSTGKRLTQGRDREIFLKLQMTFCSIRYFAPEAEEFGIEQKVLELLCLPYPSVKLCCKIGPVDNSSMIYLKRLFISIPHLARLRQMDTFLHHGLMKRKINVPFNVFLFCATGNEPASISILIYYCWRSKRLPSCDTTWDVVSLVRRKSPKIITILDLLKLLLILYIFFYKPLAPKRTIDFYRISHEIRMFRSLLRARVHFFSLTSKYKNIKKKRFFSISKYLKKSKRNGKSDAIVAQDSW